MWSTGSPKDFGTTLQHEGYEQWSYHFFVRTIISICDGMCLYNTSKGDMKNHFGLDTSQLSMAIRFWTIKGHPD